MACMVIYGSAGIKPEHKYTGLHSKLHAQTGFVFRFPAPDSGQYTFSAFLQIVKEIFAEESIVMRYSARLGATPGVCNPIPLLVTHLPQYREGHTIPTRTHNPCQ